MLRSTVIFILLSGMLTSWIGKADSYESDTQQKANLLISQYAKKYTTVSGGYSSSEHFLARKTNPSYSREVTLKGKAAFLNIYRQKTYQRLFLNFYHYEQKEACEAALEKLLSCFGNDCAKLTWNDTVTGMKITPSVYIINENEIVFCRIHCEQVGEEWEIVKKDFISRFAGENSKIIQTGCGGRARFSAEGNDQ